MGGHCRTVNGIEAVGGEGRGSWLLGGRRGSPDPGQSLADELVLERLSLVHYTAHVFPCLSPLPRAPQFGLFYSQL